MANINSRGLLGVAAGVTILLSGLTAGVTSNVINQGVSGVSGPQGSVGATGPQGPSGPAGSVGATGSQGPVGPSGPAGETGATGSQGPVGPVGPVGPTGPVGPAGEDGREVEFRVNNNILEWRYVGEQTWNQLNLNFGSNVVTSGSSTDFSNWIFNENIDFNLSPSVITPITDQAAYVAALRANPDYIEIANETDLLNISSNIANLSKNYFLSANIDLTTYSLDSNNFNRVYLIGDGINHSNTWPNENASFTGIFDGAGYEISNYTMTANQNMRFFGVFQQTMGATIKNLNLSDFTVDLPQSTTAQYIGGLIGRTIEGDRGGETTIIQNVHLDGFTLSSPSAIVSVVGGFIGETQSGSSILNSSINNVTIEADNQLNRVGGFIGDNNVYSKKSIVNTSTVQNLTIDRRDLTNGTPSINNFTRFGGMFGEVEGAISIYNSTASLTSNYFGYDVGGIAGEFGYKTRGSIEDVSITISVDHVNNDGYNVGGIAGRIDSNNLLYIKDVVTNGVIKNDDQVGGLFGLIEYYNNSIKINNVINNIDFYANDDVGGIIGEIRNYYNFIHINEFVNNGDYFPFLKNSNNNSWFDIDDIGGAIGYVSDGDSYTDNEVNEILIESTIINSQFIYEFNDFSFLNPSSYYSFDFENLGGLIGEIDEYNRIRVVNTSINSNFSFETLDPTFAIVDAQFNVDVGEIGGVIGAAYYSTIDLINVNFQGEIRVFVDELMFDYQSINSYGISVQAFDLGGAIGYLENDDNLNVVIVASTFDLDVVADLLTISYTQTSTNGHDIDFELDNIGGLIGEVDMDDQEILRLQNVSTSLNVQSTFETQVPPSGKTLRVDIQDIGGLIGLNSGTIVQQNLTTSLVTNFTLPPVLLDPNTNQPLTITDQWNNFYLVTDIDVRYGEIDTLIGDDSGIIITIVA